MSELTLFPDKITGHQTAKVPNAALGQYPTPVWVAEALIERHFPDLDRGDLVLEPTCGPGHFLQAIPRHVPAFGVELDEEYAEIARRRTGRQIIAGDFLRVQLDVRPTAIIGNPPFKGEIITAMLDRCHELLPEGGRAGFILPAFYFQAARSVAGLSEKWSISQEMIPRNIYPRLSHPLVFAMFSKDHRRMLVGFALYRETHGIMGLERRYRDVLDGGTGSVWKRVVQIALESLGGEASLQEIYRELESRRPTKNVHWQAKVRQIVQMHCVRTGPARYALPDAVAA